MRTILLAAGILACCALQPAHAQWPDVKKMVNDSLSPKAAPEKTETTTSRRRTTEAVDPNCPRSGATGDLEGFEYAASAATRFAIDAASKELKLGSSVELPERIEDVCQARKRLTYVERATSRWGVNVIDSIQQAKQALDLGQEIKSYRAFTGNPSFGKTSDKDIARLRKDMENDLELIEKAIKEKRVVNQALLAEASANMRAAALHGGLIGGWDRRLIEFFSDNSKWAYQNSQSVLMFRDHVMLLGSTLSSMSAVVEAHSASANTGPDDKKVASIMKQREQENQAFEKQLTAELQL